MRSLRDSRRGAVQETGRWDTGRSVDRLEMALAALLGLSCCFFFFQAEDGIRDLTVTGVQTCALPILRGGVLYMSVMRSPGTPKAVRRSLDSSTTTRIASTRSTTHRSIRWARPGFRMKIGRASCRERV